MSGYICLHVHYLPGIDDGVRDHEEGVRLCKALYALGFAKLVATPHIRTQMFDNRRAELLETFEAFAAQSGDESDMPELGLE